MANEKNLSLVENEDKSIDINETAEPKEEPKEENPDVYTHRFYKPFSHSGKEYKTLTFDFGKLTGRDLLAIEREMASNGLAVVSPSFSGPFLLRMAARAAGVGLDVIEAMPIGDVAAFRAKARSFLARSEL